MELSRHRGNPFLDTKILLVSVSVIRFAKVAADEPLDSQSIHLKVGQLDWTDWETRLVYLVGS